MIADVHKNVESVEKQLLLVAAKLSDLLSTKEPVDPEDNETSTVEITEELDEEGRVVCKCLIGLSQYADLIKVLTHI